MSREEVGDAVIPKVTARTIRSYEDGVHAPGSVSALRQLANHLQTTIAYLLGETDNPLRPADRLRRLGLDPGNFEQMTDENLGATIVGLVEEFTARSTKRLPQLPTATEEHGGTDAIGGSGAPASAS